MNEEILPHIGEPPSDTSIADTLTDPGLLSDFTWAVHDWIQANELLRELDAPEETVLGITMPMADRIRWVLSHVKTE